MLSYALFPLWSWYLTTILLIHESQNVQKKMEVDSAMQKKKRKEYLLCSEIQQLAYGLDGDFPRETGIETLNIDCCVCSRTWTFLQCDTMHSYCHSVDLKCTIVHGPSLLWPGAAYVSFAVYFSAVIIFEKCIYIRAESTQKIFKMGSLRSSCILTNWQAALRDMVDSKMCVCVVFTML